MKISFRQNQSGGREMSIRLAVSAGGMEINQWEQCAPSLTVANIESSISALCLAYDDLLQAKVTIHDTLGNISMPETLPTATPQQTRLRKS
jgi:phage-related protein